MLAEISENTKVINRKTDHGSTLHETAQSTHNSTIRRYPYLNIFDDIFII